MSAKSREDHRMQLYRDMYVLMSYEEDVRNSDAPHNIGKIALYNFDKTFPHKQENNDVTSSDGC